MRQARSSHERPVSAASEVPAPLRRRQAQREPRDDDEDGDAEVPVEQRRRGPPVPCWWGTRHRPSGRRGGGPRTERPTPGCRRGSPAAPRVAVAGAASGAAGTWPHIEAQVRDDCRPSTVPARPAASRCPRYAGAKRSRLVPPVRSPLVTVGLRPLVQLASAFPPSARQGGGSVVVVVVGVSVVVVVGGFRRRVVVGGGGSVGGGGGAVVGVERRRRGGRAGRAPAPRPTGGRAPWWSPPSGSAVSSRSPEPSCPRLGAACLRTALACWRSCPTLRPHPSWTVCPTVCPTARRRTRWRRPPARPVRRRPGRRGRASPEHDDRGSGADQHGDATQVVCAGVAAGLRGPIGPRHSRRCRRPGRLPGSHRREAAHRDPDPGTPRRRR